MSMPAVEQLLLEAAGHRQGGRIAEAEAALRRATTTDPSDPAAHYELSMLLYAGGHDSFVIDAYTKRVFQRHQWCGTDATYDDLKTLCETALARPPSAERLDYWQDYHAQLVMVGKHFCRTRNPLCAECPLKPLLARAGSKRR